MLSLTPKPISPKELAVLQLFACGGELYGLELLAKSGGKLGRGSLYVTLASMVDRGLLRCRSDANVPGRLFIPRRLYSLTDIGEAAAVETGFDVFRAGQKR